MAVHLLTASGAVLGLWGIAAAADGRIRDAFLAMLAATAIDDIVYYLTFVVLPAFRAAISYVYPTKTRALRLTTLALATVWASRCCG